MTPIDKARFSGDVHLVETIVLVPGARHERPVEVESAAESLVGVAEGRTAGELSLGISSARGDLRVLRSAERDRASVAAFGPIDADEYWVRVDNPTDLEQVFVLTVIARGARSDSGPDG